jgi:hypothetical protein
MSQAKSKLYDSQKANNLYFATPPLKDLAEKVCSFVWSSLKSKARRFLENSARLPSCEPIKVVVPSRTAVALLGSYCNCQQRTHLCLRPLLTTYSC